MGAPLALADKREDRSLTHINGEGRILSTDLGDSVPLTNPVRRLAVPGDWNEEVRGTFHKLYVEEDKSLQQVMTEMVELLGFQATYADSVLITSSYFIFGLFDQCIVCLLFSMKRCISNLFI